MDTPWRHRPHAISLPVLLLVAPMLMAAQPAATVSLTANPASVSYNGFATLNWSATDANTCRAGAAWSGKKAAAGSEAVGPLTATSTFTLKCHGRGKPIEQSVTVTVDTPPPLPLPSVSLIADPTTVDMNGASTLSWSSTDATSCDAGGAWSGSKPLSGNESVGPLVQTSTFTLTCTGASGSTNRPVTVTVNGAILQLSWAPNPDAIDGYITYFGPSVSTASTQVSDISLTAPGFDPLAPAVEYDATADLGLSMGDTVCFRLKAYNSVGSSEFSEAACVTL